MAELKYSNYDIVFQEVPDETTLAINITGCPHGCPGCHSPHLQEYHGRYLLDDLRSIIKKYLGMITCVCFMGGDQNIDCLEDALEIVREYGLKTCVYSGLDEPDTFAHIDYLLDYLKIGHYDEKLGGLDSPTTNQILYMYTDHSMIDITDQMRRE